MEPFVQAGLEGVAVGVVYAVLALSFWLMWDVARVVNVAHGDLAVVGAYTAWWAQSRHDVDPMIALLVVLPAAAVLGPVLHRAVFAPLLRRPPLTSVLVTLALSVGLQAALRAGSSAMPVAARSTSRGTWVLGPLELSAAHGAVALVGVLLALACVVALRRTWTGKSLRAVAQNPSAASLLGIDVPRLARLTVIAALAAALAAGVLLGQLQWVQPTTGTTVTVKVLAVAALSGLRRVRTVTTAAIAFGVVEGLLATLAPGAGSRLSLLVAAATVVAVVVRPLRADLTRGPDPDTPAAPTPQATGAAA
jgi:branched-chain amino acid transport system permease protein